MFCRNWHHDMTDEIELDICKRKCCKEAAINFHYNIQSTLVISKSKDLLKHFEISVLRHIRCSELRKIPNEQQNFTMNM